MTAARQNRSSCQKFIRSVRFLVILIICIVVLGTVLYFGLNSKGGGDDTSDELSNINEENHGNDQVSQKPNNGNETEDENGGANENENNHDKDPSHNETQPEIVTAPTPNIRKWESDDEIKLFREYLRIPTVHPDIDYKPAIAFLKKQAANLSLPVSIYYPVDEENPVVVMTWNGSEPELPSIILNSHMDVVPVYEEFWTHPPFAAEMDENGDIFARGAQDMKPNAMQYLAAIRAFKRAGIERFKRTIHVLFVPDEEVSFRGMAGFVETDAFRSLNVGFVLDEGGNTPSDRSLNVYYGERTILQTEFIFHGQSGHGSFLLKDTPGEKLSYFIGKITEFRREEARKLHDLKYPYGNVTTINLTILKGGVENNVIPAEMRATFDIRVSPNADLDEFILLLNRWCEEAGGNVTINFLEKGEREKVTAVDNSNPYWVAFKSALDEIGLNVNPAILGGATDSRFIRRLNVPALGFSPLMNTVPKLHDHDEYINAETYLAGIEIFKKIILNLASV